MTKYMLVALLTVLLVLVVGTASAQDEATVVVTSLENYAGLIVSAPARGWLQIELAEDNANVFPVWLSSDSNPFVLWDVINPQAIVHVSVDSQEFWGDEINGIPVFVEPDKDMVIIWGWSGKTLDQYYRFFADSNFHPVMPPLAAFEEFGFLCDQFNNVPTCPEE